MHFNVYACCRGCTAACLFRLFSQLLIFWAAAALRSLPSQLLPFVLPRYLPPVYRSPVLRCIWSFVYGAVSFDSYSTVQPASPACCTICNTLRSFPSTSSQLHVVVEYNSYHDLDWCDRDWSVSRFFHGPLRRSCLYRQGGLGKR